MPVCVGLSCTLAVLVVMYAWLRWRCMVVDDAGVRADISALAVQRQLQRALVPGQVLKMPGVLSVAGLKCASSEGDKAESTPLDACSICLDEIPTGTTIRTLPCGHIFHHNCIDVW